MAHGINCGHIKFDQSSHTPLRWNLFINVILKRRLLATEVFFLLATEELHIEETAKATVIATRKALEIFRVMFQTFNASSF